jgi:hypothetical protein
LLLVPWLAPARLEAVLEEGLGLDAAVAGVRLDPLELELRVSGLRLDAQGEEVAALAEGVLDVDGARLLSGALIAQRIELVGPDVLVRVAEDGSLSVAGIPIGGDAAQPEGRAEPGEPEVEEPEVAAESDPTVLRLEEISIREGRLRVVDRSREPAAEYVAAPLELRIQGLNLTHLLGGGSEVDPSDVDLVLAFDPASLGLRGQVDLDPLEVDLEIGLKALDLTRLAPYAERESKLEIAGGSLDVTAHVVLASGEAGALEPRVEADLVLDGLDVRGSGSESPIAAWKSLRVSEIRFGGDPPALRIGRIELDAPRVDLAMDASGALNLAEALGRDDVPRAPPPDAASGGAPPLAVEIGPIHVGRGGVRFRDARVDPPYAVELEDLVVDVDRLASDARSRSQVALAAKVDGYARLSAKGSLAPREPRSFLDLAASLEGLELSPFTPYAGRYAGYEIDGGRASLDVRVRVEDAHVRGENELLVEALDFGKSVASDEATRLPVPAAAVLLADGEGRIRIDLPVEGNLDDPGFRYAQTMLKTLRTLILRVVATPLSVAGGMVSLGGKLIPVEELGDVPFEPGSFELSPAAREKLAAIAAALAERGAQATLEVRGAADPALDGAADPRVLARRRAEQVRGSLVEAGLAEADVRLGTSVVGPSASGEDGRVHTRIQIR